MTTRYKVTRFKIKLDWKVFQAENDQMRTTLGSHEPSVPHTMTAIIPVKITRWMRQARGLGPSDIADFVLVAGTTISRINQWEPISGEGTDRHDMT